MNDIMRGKIEACIELCEGDAEKFRSYVIATTGLTVQGFHHLNMTDVAFEMLKRGESVDDVIEAVM